MNYRLILLTIFVLLTMPAVTSAQSMARAAQPVLCATTNDAGQMAAVASLRQLESRVITYRSLGDFEADGRLAHVSLQTFEQELSSVTAQLLPILAAMPAGQARTEIVNALASYRDGVYWWRKVDRPRVVHVSTLSYESNQSGADAALMSGAPYTVAIHWRQAAKYLRRAEALIESR